MTAKVMRSNLISAMSKTSFTERGFTMAPLRVSVTTVPSFSRACNASRIGERLTWNLLAKSSSGSQSPGRKTSSRIAARIFLMTTVGVFSFSGRRRIPLRVYRLPAEGKISPVIRERMAAPSAPEQPVQSDPASSPAAQEREARLALAQTRAEHRKASWERYRWSAFEGNDPIF